MINKSLKLKTLYLLVLICFFLMPFVIRTLNELDNIAIKYGTDKSSKWHNYTRIYDKYFTDLRDKEIDFLEIGFFKGCSARMWEEYFPKAKLYFIDINAKFFEQYGKGLSSRCHLFQVDQAKEEDLLRFIQKTGKDFDIILDDGGHTMKQQIASFKMLFPYIKSGGIYVIEDLCTSYIRERFGGGGTTQKPQDGPGTTIHFLQGLIHDLNFIGARTQKADKNKCPKEILDTLNFYQKSIESMHFYDSVCFIYKR